MLPKFTKGQPITAHDLNELANSVAKIMNISGGDGVHVSRNATGYQIVADPQRVQAAIKGTLIHDLPHGKAGVIRVSKTAGDPSDFPAPDGDSTVRDAPSESGEDPERYEWVINWCLDEDTHLPEGTAVVAIPINRWYVIVAVLPCPVDDEE